MRKFNLWAMLAASVLMLACGNRSNNVTADDETVFNMRDSLTIQDGMGSVVEKIFDGFIPAADTPGQQMVLTLVQQEYTNFGVYRLTQTFLDAADGSPASFTTYGRFGTILTSSYDVIQLVPYDSPTEVMSFYMIGDDELQMLDRDLEPIESEHNYTLRLRE